MSLSVVSGTTFSELNHMINAFFSVKVSLSGNDEKLNRTELKSRIFQISSAIGSTVSRTCSWAEGEANPLFCQSFQNLKKSRKFDS